jgi:hypothetical protein
MFSEIISKVAVRPSALCGAGDRQAVMKITTGWPFRIGWRQAQVAGVSWFFHLYAISLRAAQWKKAGRRHDRNTNARIVVL